MIIIAALLLVSTSPEPIVVTGASKSLAESAEPKKICRPGAATGTQITKNICKTAAQWEALQSQHFNKMDAVFNNGRSGVK